MYTNFTKPLFDFLAALLVLVIGSPVLVVLALVLAATQEGKIWFVQPRVGRHERIFSLIKFRTMNDTRDRDGNLLPDDIRLTRIGKIFRMFSLDELPQLINVLKGDMSLVGPRPLLVEYLPRYNEIQRRRHDVKPGITGWAQVNGRNALSWQQKFSLDVWYVDHVSFWLDFKILILTFLKVIRAEGIGSGTTATMEKFHGNK